MVFSESCRLPGRALIQRNGSDVFGREKACEPGWTSRVPFQCPLGAKQMDTLHANPPVSIDVIATAYTPQELWVTSAVSRLTKATPLPSRAGRWALLRLSKTAAPRYQSPRFKALAGQWGDQTQHRPKKMRAQQRQRQQRSVTSLVSLLPCFLSCLLTTEWLRL